MKQDTAFLFAGQGAQKVGMAAECATDERVARLFETAERIRPGIVSLMLEGDQQELNRTINTQPAMFLADLAYAYIAEREHGRPTAVCGFSVGEIPALTYAEALTVEDGFKVICRRAELMDKAAGERAGAMIAVVGLPCEAVEEIAAQVSDAWAVNYNAPEQTVVACAAESVDAVLAAAKAAGGRGIKLNVSGAFHCPFMQSAADGLKAFLADVPFAVPAMPVFANSTGTPYHIDPASMRATLSEQVVSPVRFVDTVLNMEMYGIERFIECGPGKVLTGLVGKILV